MASFSEEALELIYRKYTRLISKKIRDFSFKSDYLDIFSESMLVLKKSIEKYNDDVPFCAFFSINLRNRLITLKDRENRAASIVVDERVFLYEESSTFDDVDEYGILKGLEEKERFAVVMYYIRRKPVEEIARYLEMKNMDVYYILKKARLKMKNELS